MVGSKKWREAERAGGGEGRGAGYMAIRQMAAVWVRRDLRDAGRKGESEG